MNDFKKITKLIHEIYPDNPESVIYGYLHHSQEGQKNLNDYFSYQDKKCKYIPDMMKEYLESKINNYTDYKLLKEGFIQVLCNSKYSGLDINSRIFK